MPPKAASHPVAYFRVVPTRVIVTVKYLTYAEQHCIAVRVPGTAGPTAREILKFSLRPVPSATLSEILPGYPRPPMAATLESCSQVRLNVPFSTDIRSGKRGLMKRDDFGQYGIICRLESVAHRASPHVAIYPGTPAHRLPFFLRSPPSLLGGEGRKKSSAARSPARVRTQRLSRWLSWNRFFSPGITSIFRMVQAAGRSLQARPSSGQTRLRRKYLIRSLQFEHLTWLHLDTATV